MRHLGQALLRMAPALQGRPVCLFVPAFSEALPVVSLYTPMILNKCSFFDAIHTACTPESDAPEWVWDCLNEAAFLPLDLALFSAAREALHQAGGWTVEEAQKQAKERDLLLMLGYARWLPDGAHLLSGNLPRLLVPSDTIPVLPGLSRLLRGHIKPSPPMYPTPQDWLQELHRRVQEREQTRLQARGQSSQEGELCRD